MYEFQIRPMNFLIFKVEIMFYTNFSQTKIPVVVILFKTIKNDM